MNDMKKLFALFALAIFVAAGVRAQTPQTTPTQGGDGQRAARQRIVGEVTGVDASAGRLTVRTDAGEIVSVAFGDKTTYLRLPPGETSLEKAASVTREDVRVGDRVLVTGVSPSGGQAARQIILMARAATQGDRARDNARRLSGRVTGVDASKKQIAVLTRGREGIETVTLDAAGNVRFLRFAPDSLRASDAVQSSFAELKVGDQIRATGDRSADGARFTPEEIVAGSFTRVAGVVTNVDAARGEATVKNEQTGHTVAVAFGKNSTLKRVTPEFVQTLERRAERMEQRRASGEAGQPPAGGRREGDNAGRRGGDGERRDGEGARDGDEERRRRGGGNPQQLFESLPSVALADLKKGNIVFVTATTGADASHATAITVVTGEADFMRRLQQLSRGIDGAPRGMSPGLPGDVLGGGTGGAASGREQQPPQL
jgi:hypothetical protein